MTSASSAGEFPRLCRVTVLPKIRKVCFCGGVFNHSARFYVGDAYLHGKLPASPASICQGRFNDPTINEALQLVALSTVGCIRQSFYNPLPLLNLAKSISDSISTLQWVLYQHVKLLLSPSKKVKKSRFTTAMASKL